MVYSQLSHLSEYLEDKIYAEVEKFLRQVSPDMEEGEYPIMGDKVFARVMSYPTRQPQNCRIEAHNKYIDIQATITGAVSLADIHRCPLLLLSLPEYLYTCYVPQSYSSAAVWSDRT